MKFVFGSVALAVVALGTFGASGVRAASYDATVESYNPLAYYNLKSSTGSQTTSAVNGYTLTLENGASVAPGAGPVVNGAAVPALVLANGASGQEYATSVGASGLMGGVSTTGTILATIDLASLPSSNGRIYSIAGESAGGDDLDLQINGDNTIDFYTNGGGSATTAALTSADLGQNLFLAATFTSGGAADIYIDGALAATAGAGGRSDSGSPFYIGQSNVFGGRYFDGSISDVAVYDTALSATDVAGLYAAVSAPAAVSGAPEPATWVMLIVGLGGIGMALRRARAANDRTPAVVA